MLNDCMQGHWMERLEEQRTNSSDEHRRIAVHTPDRIPLIKPTLARAPDLGMLRLEITGNALPYGFRDTVARIGECPDHHIAERMRLPKRNCRYQPTPGSAGGGTLPASGTMIHITR